MILEGDLSPQQILEKVGGYQAMLPDTEMIEHEGKQVPLKSLPDIANAKDLTALARGYVESQREIGRRERVPGKEAKPEDVTAFKARMVERGILPAPIASPADYGIARPEGVQEALWNNELATGLATVLHKYQVPKDAAAELLALHEQAIGGAKAIFTMTLEEGTAALKAEFGDQYDTLYELGGRFIPMIFKTPAELELANATGLANNPLLLGPLMRLATYAQQDSSFIREFSRPSGATSLEEAKQEHTRVMNDPKHEHYEGYKRGDPKALAYITDLYSRLAQAGTTV